MPIQKSRKQPGSSRPAKLAGPSLAFLKHLSTKQAAAAPLHLPTYFKQKQIQIEEHHLPINIQSKFPHPFKSLPKLKGRVKI